MQRSDEARAGPLRMPGQARGEKTRVKTRREQDAEAIEHQADIIMLDNMPLELMRESVQLIRQKAPAIKIEASGNVTLETIRGVAETGVDYISSSAPMTRSSWLDLSMRIDM